MGNFYFAFVKSINPLNAFECDLRNFSKFSSNALSMIIKSFTKMIQLQIWAMSIAMSLERITVEAAHDICFIPINSIQKFNFLLWRFRAGKVVLNIHNTMAMAWRLIHHFDWDSSSQFTVLVWKRRNQNGKNYSTRLSRSDAETCKHNWIEILLFNSWLYRRRIEQFT